MRGEGTCRKRFDVSVPLRLSSRKLTRHGEAMLRMVVHDYSWKDWWKGNKTYLEKKVVIDTRPPQIEVLSRVESTQPGPRA